MKRNRLRTEKVVTRWDVAGNLDVHTATACVEVFVAPVVVVSTTLVRGRPGVLEDLEPATAAISSRGVGDLGQVHHDWAVVVTTDGLSSARAVTGLLVHLDGYCLASGNRAFR